ncbi:MAG: MOSC domain-containing protein [Acidimicrobiia bacterium]|nr:MOSC domain-containing protein [Acidimicrobiia bacterium]
MTLEGVVGDRSRGVVDAATGHLMSAKRTAALLHGSADDRAMTLPDGSVVAYDDPDADDRLSAWLGRPVHLAALHEAGTRSFEMTFDPPNDDAEYYEIPAPPGTFLDSAPVHLVTTATLRHVEAERPDLDWDVRRFRPNLVLDVDGPGFVENSWVDRELHVGGAALRVVGPTVRCAMPLRAQPGGLERQPDLFKAMETLNTVHPNHLGAYAEVVTPGRVAVGDPVSLDLG